MSAPSVPQQGAETRQSILPSGAPPDLGFFGSPYSPADQLPAPNQIGVRAGDNMEDVINAIKGVNYYTDMIGFGQSSNSFTSGMDIFPMGVNYFLPTGLTCSNGASMYQYFQGIPQGNAFGNKVQQAMSAMGLPPLKGLAPGIMEDAENGLNPMPVINAAFGEGYPQCKQVSLPVGDAKGRISDPDSGQSWIGPMDGAVKHDDGLYYQTRWIQDSDQQGNPINLTRDQYTAATKTQNPDGTPVTNTNSGSVTEGFIGGAQMFPFFVLAGVLGTAFLVLTAFGPKRR